MRLRRASRLEPAAAPLTLAVRALETLKESEDPAVLRQRMAVSAASVDCEHFVFTPARAPQRMVALATESLTIFQEDIQPRQWAGVAAGPKHAPPSIRA